MNKYANFVNFQAGQGFALVLIFILVPSGFDAIFCHNFGPAAADECLKIIFYVTCKSKKDNGIWPDIERLEGKGARQQCCHLHVIGTEI